MSTDKSQHSHRSIVKSAGVIGFATLCSRILGLARDIIIARLFGVYIYAQAFIIAFKIPNLFRDLLGEGAANAAFVPVFSEFSVKHDKKEFWQLANVVLNLLLVILMAITVAGVIFAPFIVRLIAPGFSADAEKLGTTILLTRIIFPYVLLICLAAYATSILNTLKHFSVPAFAPCLLNISIIVFAMMFGEGITGLATGVLAGGVLQLAVQVPVLYKKGFHIENFLRRFRHPAAKIIGKLMLPRMFSSCIYQLNNFVDSIFGSLAAVVGEGGVAGLYFSYRLIQFPLGVFSNALSQAILPEFSIQALEEGKDRIKHTFSFGLRLTFFVMLPASIGFMILARPLVSLLFSGGRFDAYSASLTASALFFYSVGLFAYGATKITQSCFFALKDTLTPAKVSALALAMNIILNAVLMFPMKLAGIALATSISGIISFLILFFLVKNKLKPFGVMPLVFSFLKILLASLCMAAVCYYASSKFYISESGFPERLLRVLFLVSLSVVSYTVFCFVFRVREMQEAWNWLVLRKGG
jgi:putative peptidoglycan lipid II flippase